MNRNRFYFPAWLLSVVGSLGGAALTAPMKLDTTAPAGTRCMWMGLFFLATFLGGSLGLCLGLALDRKRKMLRPRFWPVACLLSAVLLFGTGFVGQKLFMRSQEEITIPPDVDIVLLLDASGSMNESNYDKPRTEAASQFVDSLDEHCRVQVISFAAIVLDQSPMLTMDSQGKDTLKAMIASIDSTGQTDFNPPLRQALDTLSTEGRQDSAKAVILLTDGVGALDAELTNDYCGSGVKLMSIRIDSNADLDAIQDQDVKDMIVALTEMAAATGGFDTRLEPQADGSIDTADMLTAFQEAFAATTELRPTEREGTLLGSEETSAYQFLVRTVALLICELLFGLGYFGLPQWKMLVFGLILSLVLSGLITLVNPGILISVALVCLLLGGAVVFREIDERDTIDV